MTSRSSRFVIAMVAGVSLYSAAPSVEAASRYGEPVWRQDKVTLNDYLKTPGMIEGHFTVASKDASPVARAQAFLDQMKSTLRIQNPAQELRVLSVIEKDALGMSHVRFAQHASGVRVFGAELIVHLKGDVVTWMNGNFLPSLQAPVRVVVDSEAATDLAIDHLRDLMNQGHADGDVADRDSFLDRDQDAELVFFNRGILSGETTGSELAWSFSVNGYHYMVSARTGSVLDAWDTIHTALNREVYTAKNTTTTPGTLVCKEGSGCSTNDADANAAYNQFGDTYNYFKGTHNRDSYDGKGAKLIGTVHYSQNFVNAYWDGKQMVFGDAMVADDVTAHELSHAVCQFTANLTYKSQSGALNESFSDVYGVMVDREDWLMGEDLSIGAIRSLSDPGAYNQPKDMTEYKNYKFYDNGGVHINSGIPNYAAYLLSDGGTNQGVKVVAQGRETVEKIWYRAETTGMTSSSQFKDFANAAVKACGELFGGTTSVKCKETTNAFKAVKIL